MSTCGTTALRSSAWSPPVQHPAAIPLRPGFLDRIEQRGDKLITNVEVATEQLKRVLSEQNVQALTASLQNATDITQSLKEASRELGPTLTKLGPLMESLGSTSRQADRAAREVADLAQQARQSLARLNAPDGALASATRSLNDIALAAARLDGETLPAITGMATSVSAAARGAAVTLRPCGQHAAIVLVRSRACRAGAWRTRLRRIRETAKMKMRSAVLILTLALAGLRHRPRWCAAHRFRPGAGRPARARLARARANRDDVPGRAQRVRHQHDLAGGATAPRPSPTRLIAGPPRQRNWCVSASPTAWRARDRC